jgi:hypothetical protein
MSRTKQEKNKALVLEAFDTLFNKRDYLAAEYWSHYIQQRSYRTGSAGSVQSSKTSPLGTNRNDRGRRDFVIVHG